LKSTKLPMLPCTITIDATSWSQATEELLTEKDEWQPLYADSAYNEEEQEKVYKKKKVINKVIEKGYLNPLAKNKKPAIRRSPGHEHGSSIYLALWKTA